MINELHECKHSLTGTLQNVIDSRQRSLEERLPPTIASHRSGNLAWAKRIFLMPRILRSDMQNLGGCLLYVTDCAIQSLFVSMASSYNFCIVETSKRHLSRRSSLIRVHLLCQTANSSKQSIWPGNDPHLLRVRMPTEFQSWRTWS